MDAITLIRASYLLAAAAILVIFAFPPLNQRFLAYGVRDTGKKSDDALYRDSGNVLDRLAALKVPHSWFMHFYVWYLLLSAFWLYQITGCRKVFVYIASHTYLDQPDSMAAGQIVFLWCITSVHALRRLVECMNSPTSSSKMFVAHWLLGLLFYTLLSVSIWIEGSTNLIYPLGPRGNPHELALLFPKEYGSQFSIAVLVIASATQIYIHRQLNSLPKNPYTLPTGCFFQYTLTPHYLAECIEYLALAMLAAPPNQAINKTITCAFIFVLVNLGITAHGTKKWYIKQFGSARIGQRARMIPFVW